MDSDRKRLSFNFKFLNWQSLILIAIAILYVLQLVTLYGNGRLPINYGEDYFAFWSVGKIAHEQGYAEIYDLDTLKEVQINGLRDLGMVGKINTTSYSPIPVPILAIFVPIFQLFAKLSPDRSYWIWTLLNSVIFLWYMWYFAGKNRLLSDIYGDRRKLFVLALVSFPFFITIAVGQINVFLAVCIGEFVRSATANKQCASGMWLGGLLLKPQLLILIIPILFILRYWKVLWGFAITSVVVLTGSLLLSGLRGMEALFNLWFKYSAGLATNAVEYMVNWRMVGVNINTTFHTTFGWIITAIGILITLILVSLLVKRPPAFGASSWVLVMLGVFSATTVLTWHSHYHMSLILVPLLIFVSANQLINPRYFFIWVVVTPLMILSTVVLSLAFPFIAKLQLLKYQGEINAFSGLLLNLILLITTVKKIKILTKMSEVE